MVDMVAPSSSPIKVSIVEDDGPTAARLSACLRADAGLEFVHWHPTGEEAVQRLPVDRPSVVLMDLGLPRMSGLECIRRLVTKMPATAFVVLSAFRDEEQIFQALRAGAVGYLWKSEAHALLGQAIREAQAGGSPISASIARRLVQHFRAPTEPRPECEELSPREFEVVDGMARGLRYKEIASAMSLSEFTVRTYVRRVYRKLQATNSAEVVRRVFGR